MGFPMAERLLNAGHNCSVYNRSLNKAKELEIRGAKAYSQCSRAVEGAECIILMLADLKAMEEVLLTDECLKVIKGKTIIQMGTIAPDESIYLNQRFRECQAQYLEAPVLGSRKEAADGRLIVMVGSSKENFNKWKPVLSIFGEQLQYIGAVGKAAALKLALNQLIANHLAGFSLSLGIIEKNNIDIQVFMNILKESALFAPMYEKKMPNWKNRNYDNPNFPVKHLLKDVRLILKESDSKGLRTDVLKSIEGLLEESMDQGLADKDYSSIFNVINNITHD